MFLFLFSFVFAQEPHKITANAVGEFTLKKTISSKIKKNLRPYKSMIADGVEVAGFTQSKPQLIIITKRFAEGSTGRHARIKMLITTDPIYTTNKGIHVGSTLSEFRKAYPEARVRAVPPTYGKDNCVATHSDMPHVKYYLQSCTNTSAIVRIMLFAE